MNVAQSSLALLLAAVVSGCSSVVSKSGDARLVQSSQSPAEDAFRMEFPALDLTQSGTNILHVRDLPSHLAGLFRYKISLPIPDADLTSPTPPWRDAKFTFTFRRLDGTEAFTETLTAENSKPTQGRRNWEIRWNLQSGLHPIPIFDDSFDILITIDQPSTRPSDRLTITAWAITSKIQDHKNEFF